MRGDRIWDELGDTEVALLDDFDSGKLHRLRDECGEAFGWNRDMKSAAGSAAARLSR